MTTSMRSLYAGENAFDFPKMWRKALAISTALVVISIVAIAIRGLNLGIDFEGGTAAEVRTEASIGDVRDVLPGEVTDARIQEVSDDDGRLVRVRTDVDDPQTSASIRDALETVGNVESFESVGPTWGSEVTDKAIRALVVFFICIALYIAIRLEWKMAVGALVAVAHDILISVGAYALLQIEVSPATVVAFLTIMGYSLYDTIVVYDKVREISQRLGSTGRYTYAEMMNLALNRTIMRSINTTITSILPVLSMLLIGSVLLGATTLQEFGIALLVGLIVGGYSSIFVASAVVTWMKEREPRFVEIRSKLGSKLDGDETRVISRAEAAVGEAPVKRPDVRRTGVVTKNRHVERTTATGAIPPRPRKQKRR